MLRRISQPSCPPGASRNPLSNNTAGGVSAIYHKMNKILFFLKQTIDKVLETRIFLPKTFKDPLNPACTLPCVLFFQAGFLLLIKDLLGIVFPPTEMSSGVGTASIATESLPSRT
jgi:hypothetical protein